MGQRAVARLTEDPLNYISNFIDVGNAATISQARFHLDEIEPEMLRCKNFFRPSPSLRIKATGEISLCPLIESAEGYGNVHAGRFVDSLNTLDRAIVYDLHASRSIGDYLPYMDRTIFGERLDHICSARTIITMIARRMIERSVSGDDPTAVRAINEEVARLTGHMPADGPTATGIRRPR